MSSIQYNYFNFVQKESSFDLGKLTRFIIMVQTIFQVNLANKYMPLLFSLFYHFTIKMIITYGIFSLALSLISLFVLPLTFLEIYQYQYIFLIIYRYDFELRLQ